MSTDEVLAGYDGKPGLAYGLASDHRFGGELRQDVEDDIIRDASNSAHGLPWSRKVFVTSDRHDQNLLSYTRTMGELWFAKFSVGMVVHKHTQYIFWKKNRS